MIVSKYDTRPFYLHHSNRKRATHPQLDVYYPSMQASPPKKAPILVFVYGGGFTTGGRVHPEPLSLAYPNVGAFFASRGFLTVIPDYRLVPNVRYPAPAEDVRDALAWVVQNTSVIGGNPDADRVFLVGHSAGGVLASTVLLARQLDETHALLPRIKAAVLVGTPFHFNATLPQRLPVLDQLYGPVEATKNKEPLGLLASTSNERVRHLPEIICVEGERETVAITQSGFDFRAALEERLAIVGGGKGGWTKVERIVLDGHNHISTMWALSSGEGDGWADKMAERLKAM